MLPTLRLRFLRSYVQGELVKKGVLFDDPTGFEWKKDPGSDKT